MLKFLITKNKKDLETFYKISGESEPDVHWCPFRYGTSDDGNINQQSCPVYEPYLDEEELPDDGSGQICAFTLIGGGYYGNNWGCELLPYPNGNCTCSGCRDGEINFNDYQVTQGELN